MGEICCLKQNSRIDICTWYVPEGMCSVTIILKLHGQWKALRKIFSVEQGISKIWWYLYC